MRSQQLKGTQLTTRVLTGLAAAAAIAGLAGCGTNAPPAATGQSTAAPAITTSTPPSCHEQYQAWKYGPARPLGKRVTHALQAVEAAGASEDIPH